ncbi:MAG: hypothetical protein HY717_23200 [Planctomycetes bacterium]|nr:hypothetical protein [Planctomycetota bacterium]
MNPVLKIFHRFLDELEANRIDYMVMGGWAVQVWGRPRPTYDVDFTLSISDNDLKNFLKSLAARDFIVADEFLRGFKDDLSGLAKVQVSLFEFPDPIRVDLFIVQSEYQKTAFKRRLQMTMFGRLAWVISAEDLILHKLVARRHKDLAAVEEIFEIHRGTDRLDGKYLKHWAKLLSVSDLLEQYLTF